MSVVVCDLDDTICFPNHNEIDTYKKYGLAKPNLPMIDRLRRYRECGDIIIIYTARRMVTHNGHLDAILADVGDITEKWLNDHSVPYDQLKFGKPFGDVYIDDKAMRPDEFIDGMF